MTKYNWNIEPIPGFSCVQMKRDIQAKIYEETKDMTSEESLEYIRQGAERFWNRIKQLQSQKQTEGGNE
jgi:uncharacterized protein (UPF0332 family)